MTRSDLTEAISILSSCILSKIASLENACIEEIMYNRSKSKHASLYFKRVAATPSTSVGCRSIIIIAEEVSTYSTTI